MSSPQKVPAAWVHELFRRFSLLYGAQRCASLYDAGEFDATVAAWCEQLARFKPETIKAALQALTDEDRSWPPSLAEFVTLCRQCVPAPEHRRALPVPRRSAEDIAAGREQMERVKALLRRAVRRPEDAQRAPEPACTCMVGQQCAQTLCEACASFAAARLRRVSA